MLDAETGVVKGKGREIRLAKLDRFRATELNTRTMTLPGHVEYLGKFSWELVQVALDMLPPASAPAGAMPRNVLL